MSSGPEDKSYSFLHVCGGDLITRGLVMMKLIVFSTYVEVILFRYDPWLNGRCFLHVCGGDPDHTDSKLSDSEFSPRMWR